MIINFLTNSTKFLLSSLLFFSMGTALAAPGKPFQALQEQIDEIADAVSGSDKSVTVDCPEDSIQQEVDEAKGPTTIIIKGVCVEDVTIKKNDITLEGDGGTVDGTITIRTARWVVIRNLTVTGSGAGVVGTENAAFTVEDSVISFNDTAGIDVEDGAHATITHNDITNNGQDLTKHDSGRGVLVNDGGNANIIDNDILNNRSDGIGVFNGSFARVEDNTIEGNGRPAVFEAGIQVSRAVVRGNRNIIKNNGYAGIEVGNDGSYRTGTFLNLGDILDNIGAFEVIEGVGPGKVAIEVFRLGLADLRQVLVKGTIFVGDHSHLSVRGDDVLPTQVCSKYDTTATGSLQIFGFNSSARFRATNVTGSIFGGPIGGSTVCPPF